MELLIGAGSNHTKKLYISGQEEWKKLTTLDFNEDHHPDVVHDLRKLPLPFGDDTFDEIHAYEVLEHTGQQGDADFFFAQWSDFWRILKPDGMFYGTSPARGSAWAWGDPGHTRMVQPEHFIFLDQREYAQVGKTPMSDYRYCYKADFTLLHKNISEGTFEYVLRAIKPARINGNGQDSDSPTAR